MINLKVLAEIIANILGGVAILAGVIFAVVAWLKQLGLQGVLLTVAAFVLGLVIAVFVRLAMSPAQTFAEWVWTILFGLMAGLLATGAYKGVESATGAKLMKDAKTDLEVYASPISDKDIDARIHGAE